MEPFADSFGARADAIAVDIEAWLDIALPDWRDDVEVAAALAGAREQLEG